MCPHVEEEKKRIYVDASQPAVLRHAGGTVDCATLQEAGIAYHKLPEKDRAQATIKVRGGIEYTANEIERMHYGPKPRQPFEQQGDAQPDQSKKVRDRGKAIEPPSGQGEAS